MAEEKDRDSTDESTSASAEPSGADLVAAGSDTEGKLGSEADQTDPHEPEPDPALGDPEADDPDAGDGDDVPDELREDSGNDPQSDDQALVGVGARDREAAARGPRRGSAAISAPPRKDKVTPRQNRPVEAQQRTGPVKFVKESVGELHKVVYPTGQQLLQYFVVVLIFVLFIIGIVSLLDLGFGWAIFKIFS